MRIVLGGKLENAALREITLNTDPERLWPGHEYYASILRPTEIAFRDRSATFMSLADTTELPTIDWTARAPSFDGDAIEQSLGIIHCTDNEESANDVDIFLALLLHEGAFSHATVRSISKVDWRPERKNASRRRTFAGLQVNVFAHRHLGRLMQQVETAGRLNIPLVVTDEEIALLAAIEDFVASKGVPPPIDLPSVKQINASDIGHFSGGLLKFSPPDFLSVAAVRQDRRFQKYAQSVRAAVGAEWNENAEALLLEGMRQAYLDSDAARRTAKVFEVQGWIAKPIQFLDTSGIVGATELVLEYLKTWAGRTAQKRSWHLIGVRMHEVALEDYLHRMSNR